MSIKGSLHLRYLGKILFISNMMCILLGILYVKSNDYYIVWSAVGIALILTLMGNLLLIFLQNIILVKFNRKTKMIRILGYVYLINNFFSMLGMLLGNLTLSNSYFNTIKDNINLYFVIYLSYFSIFILGGIISYLITFNCSCGDDNIENLKGNWILKVIFKCINYIILILGVLFCWIILTRKDLRNFEIYTVGFSAFFSFIFLGATIMLLNLKCENRRSTSYFLVSIVGVIVFIISILPIALTPYTIYRAEESFSEAFGKDWREGIDNNAERYFLKRSFSVPSYFLGIQTNDFLVKRDIKFHEGKDREGKKIRLYFDVYMPKKSNIKFPGEGSTIVRIHGGAWVAGDKGRYNVLQMNKYLAQQGYTVFDIQYGLSNNSSFTMDLGEPEYVRGNFTIDDMINHIGIFTKYIEKNYKEYNTNLDSVFISGGSAGGHLATVASLAINSGRYNDIFSSRIKIKGFIPFYPANGLSKLGGICGEDEFVNPILLVGKESPPCLIYQGTRDSLVPMQLSKEFKMQYLNKENKSCAVLFMPLGSHGSDYYFAGQYNQIFLYYMERFMYIFR